MHVYLQRLIGEVQQRRLPLSWTDDFDDLQELARLVEGFTNPGLGRTVDLLDRPVEIGGSLLYRLSWGAIEWLDTIGGWFSGPEWDIAVAWAMSRARDPESLRGKRLTDRDAARRAVRDWAAGLTCSFEALQAVVMGLLPGSFGGHGETAGEVADGEKPDPGPSPAVTSCDLLHRLLAGFPGTSESYWLWEVPLDRVDAGLEYLGLKESEDRQRWASLGGGESPRDPGAPEQVAFRNWTTARAAFLGKLEGRADG